jgi:hypothetical protein
LRPLRKWIVERKSVGKMIGIGFGSKKAVAFGAKHLEKLGRKNKVKNP